MYRNRYGGFVKKKEGRAKRKHGVKHTHIEHMSDGSMTVRHQKDDGTEHSSAVADMDQLHDNLEEHLGSPNPGEQEADAGQHGVPPPEAAAAGLPPMGA